MLERQSGVCRTFPCLGAWKGCTRLGWGLKELPRHGLECTEDSQQHGSVLTGWDVPVAFLSCGWA